MQWALTKEMYCSSEEIPEKWNLLIRKQHMNYKKSYRTAEVI